MRKSAMWLMVSGAALWTAVAWTQESKEKEKPAAAAKEAGDDTPAGLQKMLHTRPDFARSATKDEALAAHAKKVLSVSEKLIAHPEANDEQKTEGRLAKLDALAQAARQDEKTYGKQYRDFTAQMIKDHPKSDVAAFAEGLILAQKHDPTAPPSPDLTKDVIAYIRKYPAMSFTEEFLKLTCGLLEEDGKIEAAKRFCDEAVKIVDGPNREVAKELQASLSILGSQLDLTGPNLTGGKFDVKSLQGKVVLVDFWATWCGPCVAELPNVKETYNKFHEKGFDVVSISFDAKREDLEGFLKENKVPWTQLYEAPKGDNPWENAFAEKFHIHALPTMYLLDQTGKVVAKNVRGDALAKAVEKLLKTPVKPSKG